MTQQRLQNMAEVAGGAEQASLLRVPGWAERFPWLCAAFSTRRGGQTAVYGAPGEQNLGWTAEDDPVVVLRQRASFAQRVTGSHEVQLVTVRQVHGARIRNLDMENPPWMQVDGKAALEGDGLVTKSPGRLLGILTADCVPVLLADTRTHAVGAFHAGWRGTLARVVQQGMAEMQRSFGSRPQDIVAAIGPCIRSCCFEVGPEVRDRFAERFEAADALFSQDHGSNHLRMDLVHANREQLLAAGVAAPSIQELALCTSCARDDGGRRSFFSYRAEAGVTGRMLSAIAALR